MGRNNIWYVKSKEPRGHRKQWKMLWHTTTKKQDLLCYDILRTSSLEDKRSSQKINKYTIFLCCYACLTLENVIFQVLYLVYILSWWNTQGVTFLVMRKAQISTKEMLGAGLIYSRETMIFHAVGVISLVDWHFCYFRMFPIESTFLHYTWHSPRHYKYYEIRNNL